MRYILTIEGPGFTHKGELSPENSPFTIGRDPGNSLHLPDPEKSISRKHLVMRAHPLQEQGISIQVVSSVSGGLPPYTYKITAGSLPSGMTLDQTTGVLSGTPTTKMTSSTYTLTVSDSPTPQNNSTSVTFSIKVA